MSTAKDSAILVAKIKETYGLTLAINYVERINKAHTDLSEEEIYRLALNEDFLDITDRSALPFGITSQVKGVIPEDIVLQVKSVRDATQPLLNNSITTLLTTCPTSRSYNLNDHDNNDNDENNFDDEFDDNVNTNNFNTITENEVQRSSVNKGVNQQRNVEVNKDKMGVTHCQRESRKRLLKFILTDGHSDITAVELHTCRNFSKKIPLPGEKVLVKANAEIRSGVIVIDDSHFIFVGGQVNQLAEEYRTIQQRLINDVERADLLEEKGIGQHKEQRYQQEQQQQEYIILTRKRGLEGAPLFTPLQLSTNTVNASYQLHACTEEINYKNIRNNYQQRKEFSDRSSYKYQDNRYKNNYRQQKNYDSHSRNNNSRGRQGYECEEYDFGPPSYNKNSYY